MHIPITSFGNVALRDSVVLRSTMQRMAATWRSPKLRFSGGTALEWPGDNCVWAKLDGDVDGLREIARGVPTAVRPLGFLVDRRTFRPWLSVGCITDHTTAPYLQRLVDALEDFQGELWTLTEFCLLQRRPADDDDAPDITEVVERYPLATS
jgi:2'-5' RNA ligase